MPDLETRKKVSNLIREWDADIVLSHRPWDYHPDHRAVGKLAEDAAVVVAAPYFAPYTPPTRGNPIFLFYSDGFKKPYPFDPILAVGIDDVAQKKWDCISALPSQFGDADSWQARYGRNVPTEEAARKAFLIDIVKQRNAAVADEFRGLLVRLYGEPKGRAIKYAEAFELNQYGGQATADDLKKMFPTFR
jgi:LmbE family N-acetylglucosaminyl deacetylase